jgi:Gpi18-like mannosyltransferase
MEPADYKHFLPSGLKPTQSDTGAEHPVVPLLRERLRQSFARLPFSNVVGRTLNEQSTRAALYTFWLTRTIIIVIFILTGQIKVMPDPVNSGTMDSYLSLRRIPVSRILTEEAQTADANWYLTIAASGYEQRAFENTTHHNWAFFPLYPLLLRAAAQLTGEFTLTGMFISHLFFFFALLYLHKTALAFGLDADAASRAIFYLAIFPVSYFFSLPLTESLFLLLTVASFYFAKRERWWVAGLCGALASATRFTGILLLPALAVLYWQTYRDFWPPRKNLLALGLIPAGLFGFMIYLHAITGNALAFKGALAAWGRNTGFFLMPLLGYLRHPFDIIGPWNPHFLNFWAATITLICGLVLLKRRAYALCCYALLSAFVALSSVLLQSQARYAMVVFPTFMVLASWGRKSTVDTLIRTVSLVLLSLMTAFFAAHFSIAMS